MCVGEQVFHGNVQGGIKKVGNIGTCICQDEVGEGAVHQEVIQGYGFTPCDEEFDLSAAKGIADQLGVVVQQSFVCFFVCLQAGEVGAQGVDEVDQEMDAVEEDDLHQGAGGVGDVDDGGQHGSWAVQYVEQEKDLFHISGI
mgnify:CR=1 FL=1